MSLEAKLADLRHRDLNFDPADPERRAGAGGWREDDYRQFLPPEAPGQPVDGGSWQIACRLVRDYEFADPDLVRAFYDPALPLEGRDMLLELRFLFLRFHVGVRVGGVIDELRPAPGGQARVWGWDYRTLEGHIERGQRFFEVWKHLNSGEVEFRTHSYSKAAFRNPLLWLGFRLVGRHRQAEWGRRACSRMARLTVEALDRAATAAPRARQSGTRPGVS